MATKIKTYVFPFGGESPKDENNKIIHPQWWGFLIPRTAVMLAGSHRNLPLGIFAFNAF